jgi:PAS domain-containing protein
VVYIKDKAGRFTLVNTRYEELFNVRNAEIRGKTDYDILPQKLADQFRASDLQVLKELRSLQVEEHIQQSDGLHTYLAVKFPIYDESGCMRDLKRYNGSEKSPDPTAPPFRQHHGQSGKRALRHCPGAA